MPRTKKQPTAEAVPAKGEPEGKAKVPPRLREHYRQEVVPALIKEFGYHSPMQVPRLEKVVVNIGMGEAIQNARALDAATRDLETVTGQHPVLEPAYSVVYASLIGYGPNKFAAERTLLESGRPISILRPSRIHGPGAARPREWYVLKRLLDGRRRIPLAHGGRTGNHPTASVNLARLARLCAEQPGQRILNAADPGQPDAAEIVQAIAAGCHRPVEVVGLDEQASPEFGWSPWASWPPYFLDTTASTALGYQPVGSYRQTVPAVVEELCAFAPSRQAQLTADSDFPDRFDYALDDAALSTG